MESGRILRPIFPATAQDPTREFRLNEGAVGRAFASGSIEVAVGDAVSSASYGLTEAQQVAFRPYRSVTAAPLRDAKGTVIGVLSGISRAESSYFVSGPGPKRLADLADAVAILIPWL